MPLVFGPADVHIPDGYVVPENDVVTDVLNTGDSITMFVASSSADPGIGRVDWDMFIRVATKGPVLAAVVGDVRVTNQTVTWTATFATPVVAQVVGGGTANPPFTGTAHGVTVDITRLVAGNCQFGTELQDITKPAIIVTGGLVDIWLAAVGAPWLAIALTQFFFSTLDAAALCSTGPPPLPLIDLSTLSAGTQTLLQILHVVAWPSLCRCKPGTPNPTPFPPPVLTQPGGWPTAPGFPCDPAQICSAITQIGLQLQAIANSQGTLLELQTLIQRYALPFAYLRGTRHAGLTGSGISPIGRSVGLLIEVIVQPPSNRRFIGAPPYISDLGWISCLTPDGMLDEIRLTRTATTWLSKLIPSATQVGFGLRDGVEVDITELHAEP